MTKVESEREDLRQENSRLQAEMRRLQRDRSPRAAQGDGKLQEQVQTLLADKAALQEQLQQAQKAPPSAASLPVPSKKDAADHGYTNTWKLVDQLRNQNRWDSWEHSLHCSVLSEALAALSRQKS